MDRAGWHYPDGELRASDADRDRALLELREALQSGRITAEEFGQRSGQALAARTGKELAAPLADLPLDDMLAARASAVQRAHRVRGTRVAIGACTGAAVIFAFSAATAALSRGPDLQQREFARQMAARMGLPAPQFPATSFDWAGTIVPAAIAVLLVAAVVCLGVRLARARRG
jgi:hypothetical protein